MFRSFTSDEFGSQKWYLYFNLTSYIFNKYVMFFSRTMFSIQTKPLQNETVFFHCTIIYSLSNTFLECWCSLILKSGTQNATFTLKSCTCFVLKNTWIEPKDRISFWKPCISTEIKVQNICFFSPLVPSNILVLLSLYIFWGKCVYFSIFEW